MSLATDELGRPTSMLIAILADEFYPSGLTEGFLHKRFRPSQGPQGESRAATQNIVPRGSRFARSTSRAPRSAAPNAAPECAPQVPPIRASQGVLNRRVGGAPAGPDRGNLLAAASAPEHRI